MALFKNLADNENSKEENPEASSPLEEVYSTQAREKSSLDYDTQEKNWGAWTRNLAKFLFLSGPLVSVSFRGWTSVHMFDFWSLANTYKNV